MYSRTQPASRCGGALTVQAATPVGVLGQHHGAVAPKHPAGRRRWPSSVCHRMNRPRFRRFRAPRPARVCGGCPAASRTSSSTCNATPRSRTSRGRSAGMRSVEHIKRYTTIGTAHDQGKTSGVIASGITAELLGVSIETLGTTTFRPVHPGRVRRAPGATGARRSTQSAPRRCTTGMSPGARCSRTSGSGNAAVLPTPRRGHGRRGAT
jgi:Sarcosine oxidase A3 domain